MLIINYFYLNTSSFNFFCLLRNSNHCLGWLLLHMWDRTLHRLAGRTGLIQHTGGGLLPGEWLWTCLVHISAAFSILYKDIRDSLSILQWPCPLTFLSILCLALSIVWPCLSQLDRFLHHDLLSLWLGHLTQFSLLHLSDLEGPESLTIAYALCFIFQDVCSMCLAFNCGRSVLLIGQAQMWPYHPLHSLCDLLRHMLAFYSIY